MRVISNSPEETATLAQKLAQRLRLKHSKQENDSKVENLLCFFGDLGSGKTTFIKALISELIGIDPLEVNSPTFNYLNIYEGWCPVFHFDLYRLKNAKEFLEHGFDEYFEGEGICLIEWSERIEPLLPPNGLRISIKTIGETVREIEIT